MSRPTVRVLLADDHPVYRLGLRALLDSVEGFEVVGEAANGDEAVIAVAELEPDVVVMDLRMPGTDGIEATERIVKSDPEIAVLLLTYTDEDEPVVAALQRGARGYVLKEAGPEVIVRAIHDVADGQLIVGASIAKRIGPVLSSHSHETIRPFPELTEREYGILELMAQGLNTAMIAGQLGVGEKRVRNCATEIYTKLHVQDRGQAIVRSRDAGMGRKGRPG